MQFFQTFLMFLITSITVVTCAPTSPNWRIVTTLAKGGHDDVAIWTFEELKDTKYPCSGLKVVTPLSDAKIIATVFAEKDGKGDKKEVTIQPNKRGKFPAGMVFNSVKLRKG